MKKKILIASVVVLLVAALCLSLVACNKNGYISAGDLTNEEGRVKAAVSEQIQGISGTSLLVDCANGHDMTVFSDTVDGETVYSVYSITEKRVVYSGAERAVLAITNDRVALKGLYFTLNTDSHGTFISVDINDADKNLVTDVDIDGFLETYSGSYRILSENYSPEKGLKIGENVYVYLTEEGYFAGGNASIYESFDQDSLVKTGDNEIYLYSNNSAFVVFKDGEARGKTVQVSSLLGVSGSQHSFALAPLPDGKIAIQDIVEMPYNTTKGYDFYADDMTYCFKTYVYDIAKDKLSEVKDFEYLLSANENIVDNDNNIAVSMVRKVNEDKTLGTEVVQTFDGKLNVAFDVQALLPEANAFSAYGDYVMATNGSRTVIYRGDTLVYDEINSRVNVRLEYLASSDIFLSLDERVIFDIDGSVLTSLEDLKADEFVQLGYAKRYICYIKTETDPVSKEDISYLCCFDRTSKESTNIATEGNYRIIGSGYLVKKEATDNTYTVYDMFNMNPIIKGLTSSAMTVNNVKDGYVFTSSVTDWDIGFDQTVFYYVARK